MFRQAAPPHRTWGRLQQVFGYVFAAGCLVWLLRGLSTQNLAAMFAGIRWKWICLAVSLDILAYICQGVRWHLLLRPEGDLSIWRATQAIYIGLFSNEILPLRAGELIRGYLASRWLPAAFVSVIPSIVVERFFDGLWLSAGVGLAAIFVPLPKDLTQAANVLGVVLLLATALFLVFLRGHEARLLQSPVQDARGPVRRSVNHLAGALITLGKAPGFYLAFCLSLLLLILQSLALWAVMRSCGTTVSFLVGVVVLLIIHLGTAIPNAPANVGSFQFFCVLGLTLFGMDRAGATALSMIAFFVLTIPLWLIGLFALARSGTTLQQLRSDVSLACGRTAAAAQ